MVESINDIGHVVGLTALAERVEREAIMTSLRRLGVDMMLG